MRAAAYVRISSDRDGREVGVDRQEADCRRLAELREWDVVDVYRDNDRSAWNGKARPEFTRLVGDIERGVVDAVIVYHSARLTRQPAELESFIRLHERTGVRLVTTNGDVDLSSAAGKFSARVQGAASAQESDLISERVRRALVDSAQRGDPHGGVRPYGFAPDRVSLDTHEVNVIREVTAAILAGASLRSQVLKLKEQGERTPQGNAWQLETLSRMLLRPRLVGMREHRGELFPAKWPAILNESEQIMLRAILRDPKRRAHRGSQEKHLLSGILRCGVCDTKLRYTGSGRWNAARYHCPPKPRGGNCVAVVASAVEAHVTERLLAWYGTLPMAHKPAVIHDGTFSLQRRLNDLAAAYARGDVSLTQLTTATRTINEQIAAAESDIARIAAVNVARAQAARLVERWPTLGLEERRQVLKTRFESIVINRTSRSRVFDPSRVEFYD
jgi:DNA invertase Pin-like site-specific DNA recombinase